MTCPPSPMPIIWRMCAGASCGRVAGRQRPRPFPSPRVARERRTERAPAGTDRPTSFIAAPVAEGWKSGTWPESSLKRGASRRRSPVRGPRIPGEDAEYRTRRHSRILDSFLRPRLLALRLRVGGFPEFPAKRKEGTGRDNWLHFPRRSEERRVGKACGARG